VLRFLVKHSLKSIRCYRLTALYIVAGVALATAHAPVRHNKPAAVPSMQQKDVNHPPSRKAVLSRFRLDFGEPPSGLSAGIHIARITIAGWLAFLGVLWDVRRRMKEWALIRLYGGYPCLVAGFHYFCLALLGVAAGGLFALLAGLPLSPDDVFWLMILTIGWGFFFSFCVSIGSIVYTEFCDVIQIFRMEGEVK